MILRLTASQLRDIANQLDAQSALERAGAGHLPPNTVIKVNGQALAYAAWWEDEQCYLAEFISFHPGGAQPLAYHESPVGSSTEPEKPQ